MQFKKILFGSVFLIFSGIIYEIDKVLSYYEWSSYIIACSANGGFNEKPDTVYFSDNKVCVLFFLIGVLFYISNFISYYKKDQ